MEGIGKHDRKGKEICIGHIVEWDDAEGTRTAKVVGSKEHIGFKCFKNSKPNNWAVGHTFSLESFMYKETEYYLTIIGKTKEAKPNSSHS